MPKASLRYLHEQWDAFTLRCPRMAAFIKKVALLAQNGFLRDSEVFEFNVRFSGRVPRSVYWCTMGGLFVMLVLVKLCLALLFLLLGGLFYIVGSSLLSFPWTPNALNLLYMGCVFIGNSFFFLFKTWLLLVAISATVQRVRDAGFSVRYLPLAPFICFLKSKPEKNAWSQTLHITTDANVANEWVVPAPPTPSPEPAPSLPQPSPKLCPLCQGKGKTTTGFTCPQCGGSGKA